MKKKIMAVMVGSLLVNASAYADDKGWRFLAGKEEGFVLAPTASLMAGVMSPKDGDSGKILGVEMSFNCPLLQPPTNKIRQQVSLTRYDENGAKVSSIEINPHYVVEVSPGLSIGGGPGLGYVYVDTNAKNTGMFAVQLGASAHYNLTEQVFVGGELRYQLTENKSLGTTDGFDNWRSAIKLGFSF